MEQFKNLDTQSKIVILVAGALVANVHLKLVTLPSVVINYLRQYKTVLMLATVGLAYYDLKLAVVSASLLYVVMNTKERMTDVPTATNVVESKSLLDNVLGVLGLSTTTSSVGVTPTLEDAEMSREMSDSVSGMISKPELEPSSNPLPTQSNDVPTQEHNVPSATGVHDVDESKFQLVSLPKVESGDVMGVSSNRWEGNLANL